MTNEQIDYIINCFNLFKISELVQFVTDSSLKARISNDEYLQSLDISEKETLYNLLFENIMQQIEEEGYEYFYSKLPSFGAIQLMKEASKDKLIDCIEDKNLELLITHRVMLVKATRDINYIKNFISTNEITGMDKVELIKATGDVEYIKQHIKKLEFDIDEKIELIKATLDIEYIKQWIESIDLEVKSELIIFIGDSEYTKECIKRFNFSPKDKAELITSTEDEKYIKEYIEGNEFSPNEKIELIRYFKDRNICELINNNELKLDEKTSELVMLLNWEPNFIINNVNPKVLVDFKLPKEMTIGIEIESEGELSEYIQEWFGFGDWEAKYDFTLDNGVEVVSPILHPSIEDAKEIYMVNEVVNRTGQGISDRCGAHIHIGANYLTSKQSYINLIEIWCNTEKILYAISNEENTPPRSGILEYSQPIALKVQKAIEKGSINLTDETDLDEFIMGLQSIQAEKNLAEIENRVDLQYALNNARYSGLNLVNINNGKNTIEFRVANGTLNPDLWMHNINLFGGIVEVSEQLAKIQENGIANENERYKIELFEKLKDNITDDKKFEFLLELVGLEPELYRQRYDSNIKLINNAKDMAKVFSMVKGPINMKDVVKSSVHKVSALAQQEAERQLIYEMERMLKSSKELSH